MAIILTPGQLARRADFYHQLAQLNNAGVDLLRSLEQLQAHPPAPGYRRKIHFLLRELSEGFTFTEAVTRVSDWLPAFDIALMRAGEQSGRLDACFKVLANYYTDRARVARQVILDLMYPAFLLHFGILIFGLVYFFQTSDWLGVAIRTIGVLVPIYFVALVVLLAAQSSRGEAWRSIMERLFRLIPVLGTGRHYLAIARLSMALEALLNAGVTIIEGWELAATASGSPALKRTVFGWRNLVDGGHTPAEVVCTSSQFPNLFSNQYAAGEVSGKLDDTLRRMHEYYQEEGSRRLHLVAQWAPRGVYLLVAVLIGFKIIGFYTNYFKTVQNITGGF